LRGSEFFIVLLGGGIKKVYILFWVICVMGKSSQSAVVAMFEAYGKYFLVFGIFFSIMGVWGLISALNLEINYVTTSALVVDNLQSYAFDNKIHFKPIVRFDTIDGLNVETMLKYNENNPFMINSTIQIRYNRSNSLDAQKDNNPWIMTSIFVFCGIVFSSLYLLKKRL
jgi:hypothetical protein